MIPLLLIRSNLDIAHVATGPLSIEERRIVVDFADRALANVGRILDRLLLAALNGQLALQPTSETLENDKRELIEALNRYNLGTAGSGGGDEV
jgi:hypothetical protein